MVSLNDGSAPSTLGRYELLMPIAQGGMAVVWTARMRGTRGFQKIVAIKSMLPSLSDDPQFEKMFLAEAELASRIRHPNVCEILDLGEESGTLYIAMEWVDGEPLSAINKAARKAGTGIPLAVSTRVALAAAQGLHAAHELRGDDGELVHLVHRDVSPQNILVTYDGVVKIVDFGVAKATGTAEDTHTQAGQVKGKVPFMSPEQAIGRVVDRRTDVFALGIVLYQLVTGRHPFRGDNDMVTMQNICDRSPVAPPSSIIAGCPPALNAAIVQALEKEPDKRFQTMADFARALERALTELSTSNEAQDVGEFVRSVIGDRGDKRRSMIKEALRSQDRGELSGIESRTSVSRISRALIDPALAAEARASLAPPSGPVSTPAPRSPLPPLPIPPSGPVSTPAPRSPLPPLPIPPPQRAMTLANVAALSPSAVPRPLPPPTPPPRMRSDPPAAPERASRPSSPLSPVADLSTAGTAMPSPESAPIVAEAKPGRRGATIAIAATLALGVVLGVVVFSRSAPAPTAAAQAPAPAESAALAEPAPPPPASTAPSAAAPAPVPAAIDVDSLPEANDDKHAGSSTGGARPRASGAARSKAPLPRITDPGF
jgi:serine/threonine-protein kinase